MVEVRKPSVTVRVKAGRCGLGKGNLPKEGILPEEPILGRCRRCSGLSR